MSFGEFYSRVCRQLQKGYGWTGVTIALLTNSDLMDIIYNQYNMNADAQTDEWSGIIESTALQLDQAGEPVAA